MSTDTVSPLRQRMIEDMTSRQLGAHTRRSHIYSCKRFAAFLKRSPDTATAEDIRLFQLHLAETGMSIGNRNRIMTGVRFLFRVTMRRVFPPTPGHGGEGDRGVMFRRRGLSRRGDRSNGTPGWCNPQHLSANIARCASGSDS